MKPQKMILAGAVIAATVSLSITTSGTHVEPTTAAAEHFSATPAAETAVYFAPKLDGINLDVRMMGHMRANPVQTAERFCRDQGFTSVADLTVRPSITTRTIADGTIHASAGAANRAFAMIRCQSIPASAVSTG